MFKNIFNLELVNLHEFLSRLDDESMFIGSFGHLKGRLKINCCLLDYCDWGFGVIIDPCGLYKFFSKFFDNVHVLKLGFNASINPLNLRIDDPYYDIKIITDIFRLSFHLGEDSARILQSSLLNLSYKGIFNPTIEDIVLEVESQTRFSRYPSQVYRLLRFLELMNVGRFGSSFKSSYGFPNDYEGLTIIDISHLPVEFRVFSSLILIHKLLINSDFMLIEDVDILAPTLNRALREEYAISFERSMLLYDIIKNGRDGYIVLSGEDPMGLNSRVRSLLNMVFSPIPRDGITMENFSRLFLFDKDFDFSFLNTIPKDCFLIFTDGIIKLANYGREIKFVGEFDIPDELKLSIPSTPNILKRIFGGKADVAYGILSFLSEGTMDRDLVIGYATSVLGVDATEAKRVLTTFLVNGLITEFMHRDRKYYLKLSPYGLSALDDYSHVGGG
ncbi:MAG: hypothetical protein QXX09_04435 [Candidatus Methanomethylicia archaeon]